MIDFSQIEHVRFQVVREIMNDIISKTAEIVTAFERSRDLAHPKRRIMIQQLNGTDEIDPSELLPSEVTPEHLIINDLAISDEYEYEQSIEDETFENHDGIQVEESVIFWLPRNVCLVNPLVYSRG